MIYDTCMCGELLKKIALCTSQKLDKIFSKQIDTRKFKHYSIVNNLDDSILQNLIKSSNEYQEKLFIQDMCITNSILFKQILDKLNYDFKVCCGIWIMRTDRGEFLIPHVVLYSASLDKIIDPSWWANRNVQYFDGYFTFRVNVVINEALLKNKLDQQNRLEMFNNFYGLNEDTFLEPDELDSDKQDYYDDLLNYLKEHSGYKFLDTIVR